jgi:hypothetical protein
MHSALRSYDSPFTAHVGLQWGRGSDGNVTARRDVETNTVEDLPTNGTAQCSVDRLDDLSHIAGQTALVTSHPPAPGQTPRGNSGFRPTRQARA